MSEEIPEGMVNLLEMIVRCFDSPISSIERSKLLTIMCRPCNRSKRGRRGDIFPQAECWLRMNEPV